MTTMHTITTKRYGTTWIVQGKDATGRSVKGRRYSAGDAKILFDEIDALRRGGPALKKATKKTLDEWMDDYLADQAERLEPKTVRGYRSLYDVWVKPVLGRKPIADLYPTDMADWMRAIRSSKKNPASPARAKAARTMIHIALEAAVDRELIAKNPCNKSVVIPKVKRQERTPLTVDQVLELADAMGPRWRALILVAGMTGPRLAELGAVRFKDVAANGSSFRIEHTYHAGPNGGLRDTKNKSSVRSVFLPPIAAEALRAHMDAYVEGRGHGRAADAAGRERRVWPTLITSQTNFRAEWKVAVTKIGRPDLRFHDLRHTAASNASRAGGTTKVVQRMLGHSGAEMTLHYTHVNEDDQRLVADRIEALYGGGN